MNDMANLTFSYELIDNKIPCGGFNLLGGGVKGRNIESKEVYYMKFFDESLKLQIEEIKKNFDYILNIFSYSFYNLFSFLDSLLKN